MKRLLFTAAVIAANAAPIAQTPIKVMLLFDMEGVKLRFTEDALQGVAEEATRRKSGARGLRAILEEVMLEVMYEIPSLTGVSECVVNRDVVVSRSRPQLVREKKAS